MATTSGFANVAANGDTIDPNGKNVTVSVTAYYSGTKVVGNAQIQFSDCEFTGASEAIGPKTVDSKGTTRGSVTALGNTVVGDKAAKCVAVFEFTVAPGSHGTVVPTFYAYNNTLTPAQNIANPSGPAPAGVPNGETLTMTNHTITID